MKLKLFGSKETAPMTAPTGIDVLRGALLARAPKGAFLPIMARELNVGLAALQEWMHGKGRLSPETLNAMARYVFGDNAGFDAERNVLVRAKPVTTPLGNPPPPYKAPAKIYPLHPPARDASCKPPPKARRAGWAE